MRRKIGVLIIICLALALTSTSEVSAQSYTVSTGEEISFILNTECNVLYITRLTSKGREHLQHGTEQLLRGTK